MKNRIFTILLTASILAPQMGYAQEGKILSGRVTAFGEIPLNNVKIIATKTGQKTYTDSLGIFMISYSETDQLRFSAMGFEGKKIKAKKYKQADIDLVYSNNQSSFEDATKNKHISKEDLEMAMEKYPLKGEKNYGNYDNIYSLIQSEIHTVRVSGTSVTTTKPNSFTHSQEVLYVVDGMTTSDVSFVLPMNVKTIRYVDGPGAAKYGSRGANGAIEITLK
jgi:hypothetical protein